MFNRLAEGLEHLQEEVSRQHGVPEKCPALLPLVEFSKDDHEYFAVLHHVEYVVCLNVVVFEVSRVRISVEVLLFT